MATKKISELSSAGALGGGEQLPVVQSGSTVKVALSAIYAWIVAALALAKLTIPTGGSSGQYLRREGIDGNLGWSSAGLVPDSSNAGYVLTQVDGTAGNFAFASPPLTPPAGSAGAVQYHDGGTPTAAFAGAAKVGIGASGGLELGYDASPTAPAAGKLSPIATKRAERLMAAALGPRGALLPLQPSLGFSRIGYWSVIGNASTAPTAVGITVPTLISGSAGARNVAATNLLTSMRRLGNGTAATAGSSAGFRQGSVQFFRETVNPWGGFFIVVRFGEDNTIADSRCFVGLRAGTSDIGNVNPGTLLNCVGVGFDSGETEWSVIHNDGAAVATKIPLGVNFPANTSDTAYEVVLYAPPGQASVWVQMTRLGTAHSTTVELTSDLPAAGVMLAIQVWTNNGTTAAVKTICLTSMYSETDY